MSNNEEKHFTMMQLIYRPVEPHDYRVRDTIKDREELDWRQFPHPLLLRPAERGVLHFLRANTEDKEDKTHFC